MINPNPLLAQEAPLAIRNVIVIYNPRAGTLLAMGDDPERALRKLFEARAIEAVLQAFDKQSLSGILEHADAHSVDAVVVCGGDGSILAVVGHVHLAYSGTVEGLVVAQTGTSLSSRLKGEPNSYNRIRADGEVIEIDNMVWQKPRFTCTGTARFRKRKGTWGSES